MWGNFFLSSLFLKNIELYQHWPQGFTDTKERQQTVSDRAIRNCLYTFKDYNSKNKHISRYFQKCIPNISRGLCTKQISGLVYSVISHKGSKGNEIFHYRSVALPPTERIGGMMGDEALEEKVCRVQENNAFLSSSI